MAFVILALFLCVAGSIILSSIRNGISPTPSSSKVKRRFIEALPNKCKGNILELGAGWGTLAFPLAKRYPDCTVIAYENSFIPYLFCRLRQLWNQTPNLRFERKNFYDESFCEASLVICYLFPGAMKRLKDKFEAELPSHAMIATHTFAIPGWTPVYIETLNDLYHTPLYHYQICSLTILPSSR